jgi:hypothetical protein
MTRAQRRQPAAETLAYYQSLPERRAGVLFLVTLLHAVVSLLLRVLLVVRLALLVRRVHGRRAAGEPPLAARDADWSAKALLAAGVSVSIVRRVAVGVLRRRVKEAIGNGTADPAAAAQILADPVARSKTFAELRRVDSDSD